MFTHVFFRLPRVLKSQKRQIPLNFPRQFSTFRNFSRESSTFIDFYRFSPPFSQFFSIFLNFFRNTFCTFCPKTNHNPLINKHITPLPPLAPMVHPKNPKTPFKPRIQRFFIDFTHILVILISNLVLRRLRICQQTSSTSQAA